MTPQPPNLEKLSTNQREKLLNFIVRADAIIGEGEFNRCDAWTDAELMVLALRAAQILGYENECLEQLFCAEFGIAGVTEGQFGDSLCVAMLLNTEQRILIAAGGRN